MHLLPKSDDFYREDDLHGLVRETDKDRNADLRLLVERCRVEQILMKHILMLSDVKDSSHDDANAGDVEKRELQWREERDRRSCRGNFGIFLYN